jgi:hypothetical protein
LDVPNSSSTLHVPRGNRYSGILPGESYISIRALADLFLFAFKIPNNLLGTKGYVVVVVVVVVVFKIPNKHLHKPY